MGKNAGSVRGAESVQDKEQPRIQLTIRRKGEVNAVVFETGGTLIHESETRVDEALVRGLVSQVTSLAKPSYDPGVGEEKRGNITSSESGPVVHKLQSTGEQIFSQLLPEPVRQQLRNAAPSDLHLHVDEQLIHVPWELCHDGADFLATKFRMGRYVLTSRQIPPSRTERAQPDLLKVLLIADPTENLPQAAQEAEQLCKLLDGIARVKVTLIGGKLVSKTELLTELQTHDGVHFAGHSHYDPVQPSRSGWHLHEGVLTAEELRNLSRSPLLVFSNSCQAGATAAWEGRYRYDEQAFGIGSAFLVAGVRNYIGTFWVVHDEESRDFAVAFYQGLASGLTLGEALRKARLEIRSQKGGERLTWASYMLYGDPAVMPFPLTNKPIVSSPPVRIERKLVAILHADVKGYSRKMQEDEEATVRIVNAYLQVMNDLVREHHGEVSGTPAGDNLLALFPSTTGAVSCAVEIQRELKGRNAELPANRRIEFRIAINLGDVIIQGTNVHGDGVNLAALLQHEVAEPGGICLSQVVYEQVRNKSGLELTYKDLGEIYFEKIKKSLRVYQVLLEPQPSSPHERIGERARHVFLPRWVRHPVYLYLLVLIGGIVLAVLVIIGRQPNTPQEDPCVSPRRDKTKAVVVRAFEILRADPRHTWMKEAVPPRLGSELSRVVDLTVYPSEHFDWLLQRCSLSEIELAGRLGILKVIRGSLIAEGNSLRLEAHLENVEPPALEPPDEVTGSTEKFFDVVQEVAHMIIVRLKLQLPEQPEKTTPSVDTFKLLLEGEGEVAPVLPQREAPPSQSPLRKPADRHSWILPGEDWLGGGNEAWAEEAPLQSHTPEEEIRYALEKYRQAYEKRDLTMLEDVYATFTIAQRQANTEYFQNTQNLRVTIRDVVISVSGDEAAVSYTREDEFLDAKTGQKVKLDARFTKIFVRQDGIWKITMGKK